MPLWAENPCCMGNLHAAVACHVYDAQCPRTSATLPAGAHGHVHNVCSEVVITDRQAGSELTDSRQQKMQIAGWEIEGVSISGQVRCFAWGVACMHSMKMHAGAHADIRPACGGLIPLVRCMLHSICMPGVTANMQGPLPAQCACPCCAICTIFRN